MMTSFRISEMSWIDIKTALDKGYNTVVFGVGSNEQHGPHLPTCTDSLLADALVSKVVSKLGNALQAPTIVVGCSEHHMAFPGTINIRPETLKSLVQDYCTSLAKHGFKSIVIIPSHGGDFNPVKEATEELSHSIKGTKVISYTDLQALFKMLAEFSSKHGVSAPESGGHAGESETSMVLALREDLVNMDRAEEGFVGNYEEKVPIIWKKGIKAVSENGIIGDPRKADAGKGEEYLDLWTDRMVEFIRKQVKP